MSYIGTNEYVIGAIKENYNIFYYVGTKAEKVGGIPVNQYSSALADAKVYDDTDLLRDDLEKLPKGWSYKILEINRCPKCGKKFTEHPAISREDNETEICPECGIREAVQAFKDAQERDII